MIKKILDEKNIDYDVIDAEENIELTSRYHITSVPTLVVDDSVYVNASNIISYINK